MGILNSIAVIITIHERNNFLLIMIIVLLVWSLLNLEGLIYDLERQVIVGLRPRESVMAVLALGLEATGVWEQRDNGLWLREDYWPRRLYLIIRIARLPSVQA